MKMLMVMVVEKGQKVRLEEGRKAGGDQDYLMFSTDIFSRPIRGIVLGEYAPFSRRW